MQAVQEERVPFLHRRVTRYLALISRRQGECESDAHAAGSEEPSGDLASPELLDFFLTPSPAAGSEVTGRGSSGAERAFVRLEGSEQGPRGGRPRGREGRGAERKGAPERAFLLRHRRQSKHIKPLLRAHKMSVRGSRRCRANPPPSRCAHSPVTSLLHSLASELSCSHSLSPFMVKQLCLGEAFFASW